MRQILLAFDARFPDQEAERPNVALQQLRVIEEAVVLKLYFRRIVTMIWSVNQFWQPIFLPLNSHEDI